MDHTTYGDLSMELHDKLENFRQSMKIRLVSSKATNFGCAHTSHVATGLCAIHLIALCLLPYLTGKSNNIDTMANDVLITDPTVHPIELSFPLPKSPDTKIHLQLTIQTTSLFLFLTTALNGDTLTAAPLGSFVYALPDVSYLLPINGPSS